MGINIPNDRPLTDEERDHLRHWDPRRLELHDKRFPPETDEALFPDPEDEEPVPPYQEWKVKELLEEIRVREIPLPEKKTKEDLARLLDEYDAAEEAKKSEE